MSEGLWDLRHDAAALDRAADTWTEVGRRVSSTADDVNTGAASVVGAGWEGQSADAYDAHRRELVTDADAGAGLADQAAQLLHAISGSVRTAQARLDGSFATLAAVERSGSGDGLEFRPADEAETRLVEGALADAQRIRTDLDDTLAGDLVTLDTLAQSWRDLAGRWESFSAPHEPDGTGILVVDGVATVNTGPGSDDVVVEVDPETGETVVTVDGVAHRLPPGTEVEVRAGEGDDTVSGSGPSGVTVLGGAGDDTIDTGDGRDVVVGGTGKDDVTTGGRGDRVFGGGNQDNLDGQDGDDLVDGGVGRDTIYGLDGDDTLSGGEGDDFLEGAEGDDTVYGGAGDDLVSGGHGDDTSLGGAGTDTLYAGRGTDHLDGGTGGDTSYSQDDDTHSSAVDHDVEPTDPTLGGQVVIEGSEEYRDRVEADLALLAASPGGGELLDDIEAELGDDELVIHEPDDPGQYGPAYVIDGEVNYDVQHDDLKGHTPPPVILGHELNHALDGLNGHEDDLTGETDDVPNRESSASGLPYDHDDDPDTPPELDPGRDPDISENALREDFGLPPRESYIPS